MHDCLALLRVISAPQNPAFQLKVSTVVLTAYLEPYHSPEKYLVWLFITIFSHKYVGFIDENTMGTTSQKKRMLKCHVSMVCICKPLNKQHVFNTKSRLLAPKSPRLPGSKLRLYYQVPQPSHLRKGSHNGYLTALPCVLIR